MWEWWNSLTTVNQVFFGAATFFSILFLWQFITSMVGLGGAELDVDTDLDTDVDVDGGVDVDDIEAGSAEEAAESMAAFHLFSLRAILAFFTLFSWAGALYLQSQPLHIALVYGIAWGLGAWLIVTLIINWLRKLAESGNPVLSTCVGTHGTVYMDIPAGGAGKVRVKVSGAVSMVSARAAGGEALEAGTPIRVLRTLDHSSVEVQPVGSRQEGKEGEA
jgi:hypothetical protein